MQGSRTNACVPASRLGWFGIRGRQPPLSIVQDLKLGELLDNPPPGVDEAVAIAQVVRLMKNPDYAQFRCVVFDTAPTGHTLRLLTLPDFLNTGVGKVVRLRFAIANAMSGVTNFFSGKSGDTVDKAMQSLEKLQVCCSLRCQRVPAGLMGILPVHPPNQVDHLCQHTRL